jgi:KDO2-lipid IV(A) lauroyltransferase
MRLGNLQAASGLCGNSLHRAAMTRRDHISYWLQAVAARGVMAVLGGLPIDAASWLGGFLARKIGPLSGPHKTAVKNLADAFPEKTAGERDQIATAMWDNIGRTFAEYPHLGQLTHDPLRVVISDPQSAGQQLAEDGIGGLLLGMHAGNWELSAIPGLRAGLAARHFYRAPNNLYVDAMLVKYRAAIAPEGFIRKGAAGAREALKLLKSGVHIGMLVDQKQGEGIPVRFFGRDAMTTTAPAAFSRRLHLPIAAACVTRLQGVRFLIHVEPVPITRSTDADADIAATTQRISDLMERWIRENPGQWFWVHRRWPKI